MEKLLKEYYKLFPNSHFFHEWFEIPTKENRKL